MTFFSHFDLIRSKKVVLYRILIHYIFHALAVITKQKNPLIGSADNHQPILSYIWLDSNLCTDHQRSLLETPLSIVCHKMWLSFKNIRLLRYIKKIIFAF